MQARWPASTAGEHGCKGTGTRKGRGKAPTGLKLSAMGDPNLGWDTHAGIRSELSRPRRAPTCIGAKWKCGRKLPASGVEEAAARYFQQVELRSFDLAPGPPSMPQVAHPQFQGTEMWLRILEHAGNGPPDGLGVRQPR